MKRKVIIDCDPGHDDALAIFLAAKHLDVVGITTVGGNQDINKVTTNALKLVEVGQMTEIPVARGMAYPLVKPPHYAPEVHGETGMDGPDLPDPTTPLHPSHAVQFIIDTVMSTDDVTLIPMGPLSNVAAALRQEPRIAARIPEISLMGGGMTSGNATATAEFNIWVDPEAAHVVFTSGIPIKMCGLNLTRQANATDVEIDRIRAIGNRVGDAAAAMLDFYKGTLQEHFGLSGASLHDPCAVACLIDPDIIEFEPMHVAVELKGEHTYGMTVCDHRHLRGMGEKVVRQGKRKGEEPNAEVALHIDKDRFFDLLIDTLAQYD